MEQNILNNAEDEYNTELTINVKKILLLLWNRRYTVLKVFSGVLLFFIVLTFILPKKYIVDADLYINKTNNSNISEINPFVIDEVGGSGMISLGSDKVISNEIELIYSPLVIDKVIRENNLKYKKKYGFIPNKREGEYITAGAFLGKNNVALPIKNKKNTSVIHISYKSGNPEAAYNILSSVIKNYIELHKEINSYKSKSDKEIIEKEYNRVKEELNKSVKKAGGLPVAGTGNIPAMSAFSRAASKAVGNMQGQYLAAEKSKVDISENAAKVNALSQKLEWAKLVDDMSDSSKVLVLKEPRKLRDFEYSSPKLKLNILLGIILGAFASLFAVVYAELTDKKVCYSSLGDEIIYDDKNKLLNLQKLLVNYKDESIAYVVFDEPEKEVKDILSKYKKLNIIKAEISTDFVDNIKKIDSAVLLAKIGYTDADLYKSIKETLKIHNKQILKEVLL